MCISYLPKWRKCWKCWKIVAMESFGGSEFGNFPTVTFFYAFLSFHFHSASTLLARIQMIPFFIIMAVFCTLQDFWYFLKTFSLRHCSPWSNFFKKSKTGTWLLLSRWRLLQSMLRVQTSVSLFEAKNWVVDSKFSISSQLLNTDIPKALTHLHIHSVKGS